VREQVGRDVIALRTLQETISAAIAQADQDHNERYQASLATLAGVLLAPALVASIFGANQVLEDSHLDLVWLFLAMFVAGSVTWVVIRFKLGQGLGKPVLRLRSQAPGKRRPHKPQKSRPTRLRMAHWARALRRASTACGLSSPSRPGTPWAASLSRVSLSTLRT
jgi:hypothetical protein